MSESAEMQLTAVGEVFFEKFYKIPLAFAAYAMYTLSVEDDWFICQTKEVVFTHEKKNR